METYGSVGSKVVKKRRERILRFDFPSMIDACGFLMTQKDRLLTPYKINIIFQQIDIFHGQYDCFFFCNQ